MSNLKSDGFDPPLLFIHKRVLEAISKADQLCVLLNTAKANAKA